MRAIKVELTPAEQGFHLKEQTFGYPQLMIGDQCLYVTDARKAGVDVDQLRKALGWAAANERARLRLKRWAELRSDMKRRGVEFAQAKGWAPENCFVSGDGIVFVLSPETSQYVQLDFSAELEALRKELTVEGN